MREWALATKNHFEIHLNKSSGTARSRSPHEQEQYFFTSYSYNKRMRALGALTGVSSGPFPDLSTRVIFLTLPHLGPRAIPYLKLR